MVWDWDSMVWDWDSMVWDCGLTVDAQYHTVPLELPSDEQHNGIQF